MEGCGTWRWRGSLTPFSAAKPRELQRFTGYLNVGDDTNGLTDAMWVRTSEHTHKAVNDVKITSYRRALL